MVEAVVTIGAVRRAKLQTNRPINLQHSTFYTLDAIPVAQQAMPKHWREKKVSHCKGSYNLFFDQKRLLVTSGKVAKPLMSPLTPVPRVMFSGTTWLIVAVKKNIKLLSWFTSRLTLTLRYTVILYLSCWANEWMNEKKPRAGSGVVRIDPLRFLAGCRTRLLSQV